MTNQEAYELMRVYLTRPGAARAMDNNEGTCSYEAYTETGIHRCAVGCLLSPGAIGFLEERNALTGVSVLEIFDDGNDYYAPVRLELEGVDQDFLQQAQRVHDATESWWGGVFDATKLDGLADQWGLRVATDHPETPVVLSETKEAWAPRELVPA